MKQLISSKHWLAALLIGLILSVGLGYAQSGSPTPSGGDAHRWDREKVETVIIGKFSNELNLTPEQAEQFFPRFRQFQNQIEESQRQQRDRRLELDRLSSDPNADKSRVNELLAGQGQGAQNVVTLKQQFLTDVSQFLTPQQVSRCSILLDDLPRRVHQFIDEGRGRGGNRSSQSGPHPRRRTN